MPEQRAAEDVHPKIAKLLLDPSGVNANSADEIGDLRKS